MNRYEEVIFLAKWQLNRYEEVIQRRWRDQGGKKESLALERWNSKVLKVWKRRRAKGEGGETEVIPVCCKSGSFNTNLLRIAEAWLSIFCVCIQITVGLCRIELERQKKQSHGNTKIYVVRLLAYVHGRRRGESFTNKRKRLQRWYQNTLTKPKPQIHPKELSITRSTWLEKT